LFSLENWIKVVDWVDDTGRFRGFIFDSSFSCRRRWNVVYDVTVKLFSSADDSNLSSKHAANEHNWNSEQRAQNTPHTCTSWRWEYSRKCIMPPGFVWWYTCN
jgi:hypothetical protein